MTVSYLYPNTMGVTMALFWLTIIISIIGSNAAGELNILHSPPSLKFSGSSKILESLLKEVFSASLGLSVEENSEWNGLSIVDPFNTPEAVVEVHVDGISSLGDKQFKGRSYPVVADEYVPDTYDAMQRRINQRFSDGRNKLVNIKLSDSEDLFSTSKVFGEITPPKVGKKSVQHLKFDENEEDYEFLYELEVLKSITAKVKKGDILKADNVIDFFYFKFRSLHSLSDYHGPNSLQAKEAKKLLSEAIDNLNHAFVKAYDNSVLVTVVTTDVVHTRRTVRAVKQNVTATGNVKSATSDDFTAIFNIILWFSVALVFALVSIVYAIMDMDPGRDSIIYRMTNTRMKKDN